MILVHRYDHGIQTFDTADVGAISRALSELVEPVHLQAYSNGLSEIMLGKAIKELKLPREELVIFTKVFVPSALPFVYGTYSQRCRCISRWRRRTT